MGRAESELANRDHGAARSAARCDRYRRRDCPIAQELPALALTDVQGGRAGAVQGTDQRRRLRIGRGDGQQPAVQKTTTTVTVPSQHLNVSRKDSSWLDLEIKRLERNL